ncbi:uncharacterized protein BX664DRAFT_363869 [Halteromyces radiatus]|uniref:uncharacterized protein n=1 Tax=Halteromyces radiatus TaxID=101107 RepID=UPI00221E8F5D|nr:uncharacterized protein BX664DRAFT_363869 [Halteromyces radiatus]KAI8096436.1 hypothetical protein BX664DRAFT_363869 [Halteromyces radiatus]
MEFLLTVAQNNIEGARQLLQTGIDVNCPILWNAKNTYSPVIPNNITPDKLQSDQEYHSRPLNIAVLGGHVDMVRLLLSAGADINMKDGRGRTALICAIYGLDLDASNINTSNLHLISQTHSSHLEIMKNVLLRHPNLYVSTLDSPQYEIKGITPLCLASYLGKSDIIHLLLEDGRVNVDGTDSKNASALMYAARDGNLPIVQMLLGYGASPDITDSHGWSAIQYAEKNPDIVQLCEEALRTRRPDITMIHAPVNPVARYPTNYTKLSTLISSLPQYQSSLSHLEFDTLQDIDLMDPITAPIVQIVQMSFLHAIKSHDHTSLQTLLLWSPPIMHNNRSYGALLINYHDTKTGLTAIHHAMRAKPLPSLDTLAMLYQAGADINAQTYYGRTALHHLARIGVDKDGKSWGIQKNPMTKSILAAPTIPAHLGLCASLLIQLGALVNIADPTGNTPLHFAAEFGAVTEVLEVLILDGNADLHLKNKKQQTPLDICKTDEIRKCMLALEQERKTNHRTKITTSLASTAGNIKPFDTASDYRHSLTRSMSRSTVQSSTLHGGKGDAATTTSPSVILPTSISEAANRDKELKKKDDVLDQIDADFEKILNAFLSYQTTFTDSIENALAYITETILRSWQPDHITTAPSTSPTSMAQLERTIVQLRFELREAHDMFDQTDQRAEKVMLHYREELEQVEQVHQADYDLLDLQQDKVDKLFDVFERIDSRFCQLEVDQDELIGQVESARKAAIRQLRRLHNNEDGDDLSCCLTNLMQALVILTTVPIGDPVLYLREDRSRLYSDLDKVIQQLFQRASDTTTQEWVAFSEKWHQVKDLLTKQPTTEEQPIETPTTKTKASHWKRQLVTASLYSKSTQKKEKGNRSLNELELSFDILSSNISEILKDIEELEDQSNQVMENKKRMYDVCLSLEKELATKKYEGERTEAVVQNELDQIMRCTKALFDRQSNLDKEASVLKKEHEAFEAQLEATKQELRQVRPPLLLQGLLERLETDEGPLVRVEKDWQEDANLVTTFMDDINNNNNDDDDCDLESDESSSSSSSSASTNNANKHRSTSMMKKLFKTPLSMQCLISRMDASLYCLKVLAAHHITRCRQALLDVQANLTQASEEVSDARNQMTTLYDDAAEVARQVYVFKTEVEMIIRHRKEEVVKVWEVVDEVSVGIDTTLATQEHQQELQQQKEKKLPPPPPKTTKTKTEQEDHQDRHQWVLRELERFQIVHENLQDAIEELKRDQTEIGQRIRHVATSLIEPQVDRLVGQGDRSLLSISDFLAELMDAIRIHDLGLNLDEKDTGSTMISTNGTNHVRLSRLTSLSSTKSTNNQPRRLSIASGRSNVTNNNRISMVRDRKRMSMMSTSSLSSLSSYQQERMLSRASNLSQALQRKRSSSQFLHS